MGTTAEAIGLRPFPHGPETFLKSSLEDTYTVWEPVTVNVSFPDFLHRSSTLLMCWRVILTACLMSTERRESVKEPRPSAR